MQTVSKLLSTVEADNLGTIADYHFGDDKDAYPQIIDVAVSNTHHPYTYIKYIHTYIQQYCDGNTEQFFTVCILFGLIAELSVPYPVCCE